MVTQAGHGARRRGGVVGADEVHQPRTCPISGGVKTGFGRFSACFAIGRERGIDQPRIQGCKACVVDGQPRTRWQWQVGDEDVGLRYKAMQNRHAAQAFEVNGQAALVARVQLPGVVADACR